MKFACPQDFTFVKLVHFGSGFGVLMVPGLGSAEAVEPRVIDEFRVPSFFSGAVLWLLRMWYIKIPLMDRYGRHG